MEDRVRDAFEGKTKKLSKLSIAQIIFAVIFVLVIGGGLLLIYTMVDNAKNVFAAIFTILYIPIIGFFILGVILLFEIIATIIQIVKHVEKKKKKAPKSF